jgi:hypothetical protein
VYEVRVNTVGAVSLRQVGRIVHNETDDGLSKGNCRNNERNISQLTTQHRPDGSETLECYHGPLLMPVHIFADSCKVMVLVTVTQITLLI